MIQDLLKLMDSLFAETQFCSDWRLELTVEHSWWGVDAMKVNVLSSANRIGLESGVAEGISLMHNTNKRGPSMEPWGTLGEWC